MLLKVKQKINTRQKSYRQAPEIKLGIMPKIPPIQLPGFWLRKTSFSVIFHVPIRSRADARRAWYECTTPFCFPDVPEVKNKVPFWADRFLVLTLVSYSGDIESSRQDVCISTKGSFELTPLSVSAHNAFIAMAFSASAGT